MSDESFKGHCPTCGQAWHGWQPIETAPTDGTRILVASLNGADAADPEVYGVVSWRDDFAGPDPEWHEDTVTPYEPTHWMPLPPPPSES